MANNNNIQRSIKQIQKQYNQNIQQILIQHLLFNYSSQRFRIKIGIIHLSANIKKSFTCLYIGQQCSLYRVFVFFLAFIYNFFIQQKHKMSKKLAKGYTSTLDCTGWLKTKHERSYIQVSEFDNQKSPKQSSNAMINPQQEQQTYTMGKVYYNSLRPFCCIFEFYCLSCNSREIQMNREKVVETRIPFCCPCLGPFQVENKLDQKIGKLQPNCYICYYCPWSLCLPCCMSLDVQGETSKYLYQIKRQICTCCCCTRWDVLDRQGDSKGQFRQTGWGCHCCFPNYEIDLPDASQADKLLVLSSLTVLP